MSENDDGGPVILVTAAGRGIGAACAEALAAKGCRLVLMSPTGSASQLAKTLGGVGVDGSITNTDDLSAMVNAAISHYGRIDGLVINTGVAPRAVRPDGTVRPGSGGYDPNDNEDPAAIPNEDWIGGFEMTFLPIVDLTRLVMPIFRKQGGGSVVAISSASSKEPRLRFPISSVIRGAVQPLIKLYADRFAREGIRFNAVLPGFIDTYEQPEGVVRGIPMGRQGTAMEIADVVTFLMSEEAGYITGQGIVVDGGVGRSF